MSTLLLSYSSFPLALLPPGSSVCLYAFLQDDSCPAPLNIKFIIEQHSFSNNCDSIKENTLHAVYDASYTDHIQYDYEFNSVYTNKQNISAR